MCFLSDLNFNHSYFNLFSYANATSATVLLQHLSHEHRIQISTERTMEKQKKLTDLFVEKKKEGSSNLNEKFVFSRRLLLWLCRDLLPFQVVEKVGFLDFVQALNRKKSDIPSRATISNMALDDMYICLKTKLIQHLKESEGNVLILAGKRMFLIKFEYVFFRSLLCRI